MSIEFSGNKRATNLETKDKQGGAKIVGKKYYKEDAGNWKVDGGHVIRQGEAYVRYEIGTVGCLGLSIVLPSGAPMSWEMIAEKVKEARRPFQADAPFVPSEDLQATGLDFDFVNE